MPVSKSPLVERIARVLAGAAFSSNAEGSDPSAGEEVDLAWREHVNQALAVLHTLREPDEAMAAAGDADVWRNMVEAAIAQNGRLSPRDSKGRGKEGADPRWTLVACILASSLSFVEGSVLSVALARDPRRAMAPARRTCSGSSTPICCRCRRCCCSAERSATISGGKRLLLIGTSIFAVTSLVCALAPSLPILLAARAAQGIGAALLLPNSLALLNAAFPGEKRGRAVGIWAAAGAAAAAVAPLIGGWLVGNVGWPAIFYINLPLAIGAIHRAGAKFVEESRDAGAGRTDYAGAVLATAGLGGLTYALTLWSATRSFGRRRPIALGTRASSLLAGFLFAEHRRGDRAMMPLTLFAGRCFSGLNLLTFLLYGAFGAAMLLIPYVLISSGGYSPVQAGLAMLPLPVLMTALSPTMGSLAARIGPRIPLTVGPADRRGRDAPWLADQRRQQLLGRRIPDDPGDGDRHDHRGRTAHFIGARLGRGAACRDGVRASTAPSRASAG